MMLGGLALQEGTREGNRAKVAQAVEHYRQVVDGLDDTSFVAYADPYAAHTRLGVALLQRQRGADALREFKAALQYRPDRPGPHYDVGLVALAAHDLPSAKEHFARALELAPAVAAYRHNLAVTLLRLGEAEACVLLLGDYVRDHEDDWIIREDLASALLVLERFDEAGLHFEVLVRSRPEDPIHRARLAWCQWKTGEQEEAKRNLQRARDKAPNHRIVLQVTRMIDRDETEPENEEQIEGETPKGEGGRGR
jgi:tetratricopeptide (TPR) repeat protein